MQRLGGNTTRKLDFRLITTTNKDLENSCAKDGSARSLYTFG